MQTLNFTFNRDGRFRHSVEKRIKEAIDDFVRLFINKTIPDTVDTAFVLLNMRKNHVRSRTRMLRNMFKTSQIPDWPHVVAFGVEKEGKAMVGFCAKYTYLIRYNDRHHSTPIMRSRLAVAGYAALVFPRRNLASKFGTQKIRSGFIFCDNLARSFGRIHRRV